MNKKIRENISLDEKRNFPYEQAIKLGAMALFGEKYGNQVRVIKFGDSIELCGGTHVKSTGQIGYFKIVSETAIAAGIRRIEAITGDKFSEYLRDKEHTIEQIKLLLNSPQDIIRSIKKLIEDNENYANKIEDFNKQKLLEIKNMLLNSIEVFNDINIIVKKIDISSNALLKDLAYQIKGQIDNLLLGLATIVDDKPQLLIMISDNLVEKYGINASDIVRKAAKEINGGGGGQKFFATAGGKNVEGIDNSLKVIKECFYGNKVN